MAKLIFLDVDGVLNRDSTKEKVNDFCGVDTALAKLFVDWYKQRDYQIILSSTWRLVSAFGDFKGELNRNDIYWIDETPELKGVSRGHEIEASIQKHKPDLYVILDDMGPSEFLKHQRARLVQTSGSKGLEPKKLVKMDELLGHREKEPQE